jgi:hypothetical protein
VFRSVRLTIGDRCCNVDVSEGFGHRSSAHWPDSAGVYGCRGRLHES